LSGEAVAKAGFMGLGFTFDVARFLVFVDFGKSKSILQGIMYCPWCSKKLPERLRDKWFETLEKEYNLDDPCREEQEKWIPKEFETDEWWKKRGL
jgi:hypothetical protein